MHFHPRGVDRARAEDHIEALGVGDVFELCVCVCCAETGCEEDRGGDVHDGWVGDRYRQRCWC